MTIGAKTCDQKRKFPHRLGFLVGLPLLALLLGSLLLTGCSDNDPADTGDDPQIQLLQDFLPGAIAGFIEDGDVFVANTEAELQEIVNGEFVEYQSRDLQEAVEQNYLGIIDQQSDVMLTIWLLDMNSPENAAGIMAYQTQTGYQDLPDLGDAARDKSSFTDYTIWFHHGKYAVRIFILNGSTDAQALSLGVAQTIDGKMTD
jgi:hypothetical protein